MDDATKAALLSAVRSILIAAGGIAVAHGYLNDGAANEMIGAVMVIMSALWGVVDKYVAEKSAQHRETAAMQAGMASVGSTTTPPNVESKGTP